MSQDSGVLAEMTWNNNLYKQYDYCDNGDSVSTSWDMAAGVSADTTSEFSWDTLPQYGSNRWRFFCHFTDRPWNLTRDVCDGSTMYAEHKPVPDRLEATAKEAGDEDSNLLYMEKPRPDDNYGDSENDSDGDLYLDLFLDLAGAVGNVYTSAASVVVKYFIQGSDGTSLSYNSGGYDWDIPLEGGYDDLPHEGSSENKIAEVSTRVHNQYSSGDHDVYFYPKYTFRYLENTDADPCTCDLNSYKYKSTAPSIIDFATYSVA